MQIVADPSRLMMEQLSADLQSFSRCFQRGLPQNDAEDDSSSSPGLTEGSCNSPRTDDSKSGSNDIEVMMVRGILNSDVTKDNPEASPPNLIGSDHSEDEVEVLSVGGLFGMLPLRMRFRLIGSTLLCFPTDDRKEILEFDLNLQ